MHGTKNWKRWLLVLCWICLGHLARAQQFSVGGSFGLPRGISAQFSYQESGYAGGLSLRLGVGVLDFKPSFGVTVDAVNRFSLDSSSPTALYVGVGLAYIYWGSAGTSQPVQTLALHGIFGGELAITNNVGLFLELGAGLPFFVSAPGNSNSTQGVFEAIFGTAAFGALAALRLTLGFNVYF